MRKLFLVVITLLLLSTSCFAADWEWLYSDAEEGFFFDKSSVVFRMNGQIVDRDRIQVWIKTVLDESYATEKYSPVPSYFIIRYEFDLANHKMRYVAGTAYNKKDEKIGNTKSDAKWKTIDKDSPGDFMLQKFLQYVPVHTEEIEQRTRGN